jgi:hypothetical protein
MPTYIKLSRRFRIRRWFGLVDPEIRFLQAAAEKNTSLEATCLAGLLYDRLTISTSQECHKFLSAFPPPETEDTKEFLADNAARFKRLIAFLQHGVQLEVKGEQTCGL